MISSGIAVFVRLLEGRVTSRTGSCFAAAEAFDATRCDADVVQFGVWLEVSVGVLYSLDVGVFDSVRWGSDTVQLEMELGLSVAVVVV